MKHHITRALPICAIPSKARYQSFRHELIDSSKAGMASEHLCSEVEIPSTRKTIERTKNIGNPWVSVIPKRKLRSRVHRRKTEKRFPNRLQQENQYEGWLRGPKRNWKCRRPSVGLRSVNIMAFPTVNFTILGYEDIPRARLISRPKIPRIEWRKSASKEKNISTRDIPLGSNVGDNITEE